MRISDWSSDVCSSDLGERQHRPHPLATAGDEVARELRDQRDLALHPFQDDAVHMIEVGRDEQEHCVERGRALRVAEMVDCCGHLAPPLRAGGRKGKRRSEEHTSELQSLMRISYAVFCLKKQ